MVKGKRLKGIPRGRPKITKGFVRDVKQASKIGKRILKTKLRKIAFIGKDPGKRKSRKKRKTSFKKFKVPNVKLVKTYGKPTRGIL